jgi:hypothetical protein
VSGGVGNPIYAWSFSVKVVFPIYYVRVLVAIYVFVSASMEMASSTISDLCTFVRQRDLLPGVNGGVERLKFLGMGLQILLL